jgi:outer membrane immunogenic protein
MMRRISLGLLAATAMGVIASQGALAADLRPAYKAPPPAPPPVQDWSGIYVGLEAGYGWGKQNFDNFDPFFSSKEQEVRKECLLDEITCGPNATIGSVSQSGWLAGGFVGAQKQWGSWVLGIEADFDAADIKGSTTAKTSFFGGEFQQQHTMNSKIDQLGTVRGKVGWAWSPNWMIYATGGMAFAHVKNDFSASQSCDEGLPCFGIDFVNEQLIGGVNGSAGTSMFGWTLGAGLDYKWQLDQGSAIIFGVEYLHYQFAEHSLAFGGPQNTGALFGGCIETLSCGNIPATFTIGNATQTIDTIKGRISYLFSIH